LEKYHHPKKNEAQQDFTDFIAGADVVFIAVLQMLHQSCCEEKSLQTRSQNPKAWRKTTHKVPKAWKPEKNVRTENVTPKQNKKNTEARSHRFHCGCRCDFVANLQMLQHDVKEAKFRNQPTKSKTSETNS